METFTVKVWLKETSQPIIIHAVNAYQKGGFYCVYDGTIVHKFPLISIFRVQEEYHTD